MIVAGIGAMSGGVTYGTGYAEARSILIRAFLTEALEPVTHEGALGMFEAEIESWWTA